MGGWGFDDDEPDPLVERAAANGVAQARRVRELVLEALANIDGFAITSELLCELHRLAMDGIVSDPGEIRQADNEIAGSVHEPPAWPLVPQYLDEMCAYLNGGPNRNPIHLAAYALWRLNWIHPFRSDGNGRTAKALCYLILCIAFGRDLPGTTNVVDFMQERAATRRYREGLDAADLAARDGRLDVEKLETLISDLTIRQLQSASS